MSSHAVTAASRGLSACHQCCHLSPASMDHCSRCGMPLHQRVENSLQRTLALLITASILYIPANMYPIMYTDQFGATEESTIIGGILLLIELGSVPIALIIFLCSVMVPIGKLLALFYLVWSLEQDEVLSARQRSVMYRVTEFIGKWSMIDVFVVAILAALVHLVGLLVIRPGIAVISFSGVVLITMLAAQSFDPRLMWDKVEEKNRGR